MKIYLAILWILLAAYMFITTQAEAKTIDCVKISDTLTICTDSETGEQTEIWTNGG